MIRSPTTGALTGVKKKDDKSHIFISRCPECDKVFNCPANLASHRRWHKPRPQPQSKEESISTTTVTFDDQEVETAEQLPCSDCGKKFRRLAYLRKHQATHQQDWQRLMPLRPIPRMAPRLWRPPPLPPPLQVSPLMGSWTNHFWKMHLAKVYRMVHLKWKVTAFSKNAWNKSYLVWWGTGNEVTINILTGCQRKIYFFLFQI